MIEGMSVTLMFARFVALCRIIRIGEGALGRRMDQLRRSSVAGGPVHLIGIGMCGWGKEKGRAPLDDVWADGLELGVFPWAIRSES